MSAACRPTGVVLMAYGTPRRPEDIEAYYTDIRRGRPPTAEALAELTARYAAIGGVSPLAEITERQRAALQRHLDVHEPGGHVVTIGLKHAAPSIEAATRTVLDRGAGRVVGLVLAPHFSSYSIGQYLDRLATAAAGDAGAVEVKGIASWAREPAFADFLATDLARRIATMRRSRSRPIRVLFTAHALPQRIIDGGDPYPAELRATAEAVAARLAIPEHHPDASAPADWSIAWQSAGRTPEPWIGPDILAVIDELGRDAATGGVIVCACGFVADHLEVLYDLDIEAARRAGDAGLAFDRTSSVNDDDAVMGALADRVLAEVAR